MGNSATEHVIQMSFETQRYYVTCKPYKIGNTSQPKIQPPKERSPKTLSELREHSMHLRIEEADFLMGSAITLVLGSRLALVLGN